MNEISAGTAAYAAPGRSGSQRAGGTFSPPRVYRAATELLEVLDDGADQTEAADIVQAITHLAETAAEVNALPASRMALDLIAWTAARVLARVYRISWSGDRATAEYLLTSRHAAADAARRSRALRCAARALYFKARMQAAPDVSRVEPTLCVAEGR